MERNGISSSPNGGIRVADDGVVGEGDDDDADESPWTLSPHDSLI